MVRHIICMLNFEKVSFFSIELWVFFSKPDGKPYLADPCEPRNHNNVLGLSCPNEQYQYYKVCQRGCGTFYLRWINSRLHFRRGR